MKRQKFLKLLTLVFTLTILATMAINASALIDDPTNFSANIPDNSVNRRDATSGNASDTGTIPEETQNQTGAVDNALDKASEAVDDVTGALGDMKDDVDDAIDDTAGNSFMGVVIAILIAVAVIILIIVMVSKNTGKHNRK